MLPKITNAKKLNIDNLKDKDNFDFKEYFYWCCSGLFSSHIHH